MKLFNRFFASAAIAATSVASVQAQETQEPRKPETNSIYSAAPFYEGQQYCQFTLPDELDFDEAERRYNDNGRLHPHLSAYFSGLERNSLTHTYLWFQQERLPQIITGDDYVQIYTDMDGVIGNRLTVNRLEREDETLTILDSVFNGSIVAIDFDAAEITVTLRDGRSETSSFDEIDHEYEGEDRSVMRFEDLGLIAYPVPTSPDRSIIIAVDEDAKHKDAILLAREQYLITLQDNGYISAQLSSYIDYTNPLLGTSEVFANFFPPMMLCNSEWQRTNLKSFTPHDPVDNVLDIELGR